MVIDIEKAMHPVTAAISVLILLFYFTGMLFSPKVTIKGHLPQSTVARKKSITTFTITNTKSIPIFDISLAPTEMETYIKYETNELQIDTLAPYQSANLTFIFTPLKRGIFTMNEPKCYSSFPFNFFRFGYKSSQKSVMTVVPLFTQIPPIALGAKSCYQQGGIIESASVGESPEYIGNREFNYGDNPRHIDFHAWARIGIPVVKEYNEEYFSHVAVVLDTQLSKHDRLHKKFGYKSIEAAISMSASIVHSLSNSEDIIDLLATGEKVYTFHTRKNQDQFDHILEILAGITPTHSNPFEELTSTLSDAILSTSGVVFIFLDWNKSRKEMVDLALENGLAIKVYIISDKKLSDDYHEDSNISPYVIEYRTKDILERNIS